MQPITSISASTNPFVYADQTIASANITFPQPSFPLVMRVSNAGTHPFHFCNLHPVTTQTNPVHNQPKSGRYRFQVKRESVSDDFWQSFKQPIDRIRFNQLYTHFLFTSWNPSDGYKLSLKTKQNENGRVAIHKSIEVQEYNQKSIIELYNSLAEVLLYNSLKNRATFLVYSIMETHKYNLKLNNTQLSYKEGNNIIKQKRKRINKIASHYENAYDNTYIKYLNCINKLNKDKTVDDIIKLKTTIKVLRTEISKYTKAIADLGLNDLPYINYIIDTLIKNQKMEHQIDSISPTDYTFSQSGESPRKKKCTQSSTMDSEQGNIINSTDFSGVINQSFDLFVHNVAPFSNENPLSLEAREQGKIDQSDPKYQAILEELFSYTPSVSERGYFVQDDKGASSSISTIQMGDIQQQCDMSPDSVGVKNVEKPKCLQISKTFKDKLPQGVPSISEEALFISFLEKITEKAPFFYEQEKVFCEEINIKPENFYNSILMLSALNAQILLLKLKNRTMNLITHEDEKDRRSIASDRRCVGRSLLTFIDNILIYKKSRALLQSEQKNELPNKTSLQQLMYDYGIIKLEIRNSQKLLKKEQAIYDLNILCNDENKICERFHKLIDERVSLSSMAKSFPSLSLLKIKQLIKDILNISPTLHFTETQLSELKFTLGRESVEENFWELLKNDISKPEFKKQYYNFIFTSWESAPNIIAQVDNNLSLYADIKNYVKLGEILLERCFQVSLKLQAFCLIHYILKTIKNVLLLNEASRENRKKIILRTMNKNLDKINNNLERSYILYKNYIKERNQEKTRSIQAIDEEIKDNRRYIYNNKKADDKDISAYLLITNDILKELESKEILDSELIINMVNGYLQNGESCRESIPASEKGILQFAPSNCKESAAHHSAINLMQQPSSSEHALDEAKNVDYLIGNQEAEKFELSSQLEQLPSLEEQIEEFLEMDENSLLNFFSLQTHAKPQVADN